VVVPLRQFAAALTRQEGDWDGVTAYLDVDSITTDAVDAAIANTFAGAGDGAVSSALKTRYESLVTPSLRQGFEETLRTSFDDEPNSAEPTIFMTARLADEPVSVQVDGDTATLVLGEEGGAANLEYTMTKNEDGAWRIIGWTNAETTLETAGGSWWEEYTSSPGYAVARITITSLTGDWEGFREYVDLDSLTSGLVDAARNAAASALLRRNPDNPFADLGVSILQGTKPSLTEEIKAAIRRAVEDRVQSSEAKSAIASFIGSVPVKLSATADTAYVTYESVDDQGETREVVIRLERKGDTWVLVSFENASEVVRLR
jgi:hypothetical protein